jgi:hypothetical protein
MRKNESCDGTHLWIRHFKGSAPFTDSRGNGPTPKVVEVTIVYIVYGQFTMEPVTCQEAIAPLLGSYHSLR